MGWRFRRSIRLAPGVRWNFGKKSTSFTIGPRGFKTTIGTAGTRQTVGLPGTGLSYTVQHSSKRSARPAPVAPAQRGLSVSGVRGAAWFVVIVSGLAVFHTSMAWAGVIGGLLLLAITPRASETDRDRTESIPEIARVDGAEWERDEAH